MVNRLFVKSIKQLKKKQKLPENLWITSSDNYLSWGGGDLDWDPKQIWHSESIANAGSNFVSYSNPKVDKLIDESRVLMDKAERIKKLREVYKTIAEDVPYIFLFNGKFSYYAHNKHIGKEKDTYVYGAGSDYWWMNK